MSKKHRGGPAPIPPGNRQKGTDPDAPLEDTLAENESGTGFNEQDPKRRLGNFGGAGEHPRQQPGPLNDGGSRQN